MKDSELIILIDRYFEGTASLDEERILKEALRECESDNPRVREVKAVMAYIAMCASSGSPVKSRSLPPSDRRSGESRRVKTIILGIAASVAVLLGLSAYFTILPDDSRCYTMIACVEDPSRDKAFDLISSQLEAVGEASGDVEEDVKESLDLFFDL